MSSPDPVSKTDDDINERQSQSQSQQQLQSTSSSPNAILVEEIFEDPAVVSPSSAKDSPPKNPQSDDMDSATGNTNNNVVDVGDQLRPLAEQGRVSSVVGKIVPTIQDDEYEEDGDETPLEVQLNVTSTNSNNNSTIIPKLNLPDKQQQQQQQQEEEEDDDDLNSSEAPTGRSINLSERNNNNNENNAASSSSAPLSSRLSLPPTGPSAANINNQNNNNTSTLHAPHHHHNRTGSALSSGRTSPRVQGISVTFKIESHHQNQNQSYPNNNEGSSPSSSPSPAIAPSSNNNTNNNSSKNNHHHHLHQDNSSSSASTAHLSEAEREVQIRNEQLEILSIGVRAKYPRCVERNQSDRTMTDALIQQYRKLMHNNSTMTTNTSLISQAVDDFLNPVTTRTSKATVSGIAWTVSNLLGASNAAASAIHQQGHTNKSKLEPIIYSSGAGIINVRGTMLIGTILNHSQNYDHNNDNSNNPGTNNQHSSFVDFDPAALQSVTALQTSMQMWTAPQFFVDLANDGPFSLSRFDDPNQGMIPASAAELVAGASRFRTRTPPPSSSSSSPSQSAKKNVVTKKLTNVANSAKENETTTTTSVRFSLYHLKKDLVIQFRCQSSHDMIHLKNAISVALAIAQNQQNNKCNISTSSEKGFSQISLRIEHDEKSLEKFSKNKKSVSQPQQKQVAHGFYFLNKNRFSNPQSQHPLGHGPSMSLFGGYTKLQATGIIVRHESDRNDGDERKTTVTHHCNSLVWTKNKTNASDMEKESNNVISRSLSRIPGFPVICSLPTTEDNYEEIPEDIECFTVPVNNFLPESNKTADAAKNDEQIKSNHATEHFSLWELAKLVQAEQQQRVHPSENEGEDNNNNNNYNIQSPISGFLSAAATKYVIAQLALTISLAHRRGIVVGPLTPSRILYFFQMPENINLVVEMMEKHQNISEKSPSHNTNSSHNSPSSSSSSPTKQLVMSTPPSHNSLDNGKNNNKTATKSLLSVLPPLFATLIGSGEAPCPRVWKLLRTSPSLLPFLPTWFLREGLLKLAVATKKDEEEEMSVEKKLLEESSGTTSQKRSNDATTKSRHNFNTSSSIASLRNGKQQQTVEADRWTQGDDWASLGCLMFWLRTGRPVHAEKENFLNSNNKIPSSLSSSPQIHQFVASQNISSNHTSTSAISPLNQYVNTLIESLEEADRITASNWQFVLSQFAIAPTLSEWNWRVLKNINASSSSSARHNHNQTTNKPPSTSPQHHNQHSSPSADGDMLTSLISPVERNLLLRLLQLPEAQVSSSNSNQNNSASSTINGIPVVFDARGNGEGNVSSSRSSSRNTTPRGGNATTCRNTEPPSATDILLHPYFAHVNWLDVFNQDANSGVVTN